MPNKKHSLLDINIRPSRNMECIRKLPSLYLIPHFHLMVKLEKSFKDCVKIILYYFSLGKLLIIKLKVSLHCSNDLIFKEKCDS